MATKTRRKARRRVGRKGVGLVALLAGGGLVLWLVAREAGAEELPPAPGPEPDPEPTPGVSPITAGVTPPGSGIVVFKGLTALPELGDRVTIEAIPNAGWQFLYWEWDTGDIFGRNPFTVTLTRVVTITAHFRAV